MKMAIVIGLIASVSLLLPTSAIAQDVAQCDKALVMATYNRTDLAFLDWRLAEHVDEGTYDTIKREAGARGTIYGVPISSTYGEFKQNIRRLQKTRHESYTQHIFRNVAWTGLDPDARTTYSHCLDTVARLKATGLMLIPLWATVSDITFQVRYVPVGNSPNPMPVTWSGVEAKRNTLPKAIRAGSVTVVVPRPKRESTLAVNGDGITDRLMLTPMPTRIPFAELSATSCEITQTPRPLPTLGQRDSTSWTCPPMRRGTYRAAIRIKPTAGDGFRVAYNLSLEAGFGNERSSFDLKPGGGQLDVNLPGSGLPDAFESIGQVVTLPDGPAVFLLSVNGVAHKDNFPGQGRDGVVSIPEHVEIRLDRL
jgi:hypothetical protein